MRNIEAVLFDLDDTLHDDTFAYRSAAEEVAREVAAERGIDALALKNAYVAQAEGFWTALDVAGLKKKLDVVRRELWNAALSDVGIRDDGLAIRSAEKYNRYRAKYLKLFAGAADLLSDLRGRGIKLGLLTNGFSVTHREKIALLQIGDYFDAIFIADEVGMLKPDPLLFAHACMRLERPPAASAMVGDRYERDIRGAHVAGLFTVWMNVHGDTLPPGAPAPDKTIGTVMEVRAALGL
ncbi:MAG: HAD family hydrolase [Candidatus Eremiobacteraeota bacterium]|nr:HAD family hydrolase [Candidatus Eremiobacteraeota bacterium]